MNDKSDVLARACEALERHMPDRASNIITAEYPFSRLPRGERSYTARQSTRIFARDGFIDRYSGRRLVFPGTLRLLSILLPREFPYQSNWKTDECHFAFWDLFPTIDHVVPVTRGGPDSDENWVTTSMLLNQAKANFTLEELGWTLHPANECGWDGLTGWFLRQADFRLEVKANPYLRRWHNAARTILVSGNLAFKSSRDTERTSQ